MYKIGESFDPEQAKLVDVSELHNLDYGFEAYATQGFNAPDGRAYVVSWLALPDISYPTDSYDYQGALSLVKELTIKDGKLYQYPVESIKDLRAERESFANKAQTQNCYELELQFEKDSQNEIVLFADQEGKGLALSFDLANGLVTVDRSKQVSNLLKNLEPAVAAQSITKPQLLLFLSTIRFLKSLSTKEKKYFLVGSTHTQIKLVS